MLTAAIRDLHLTYPGRYVTDVRTSCIELWENNPWLSDLADDDPEATLIELSYPLINQSNQLPYHTLHGFRLELNNRLGLNIRPTCFHGDLHLSDQEKSWYSQIYELVGMNIPYWVIDAGGKFDVTIKWWSRERYQQVVDHFQGKIAFVQVGGAGHYHPALNGVIDLRGRTDMRQLVRLVWHSIGGVCAITALMHIAAAVEWRDGIAMRHGRPCVVIGGAREPSHWEAYPGHQFLSTNGCVPCAPAGGCWKDRTYALGDGWPQDEPQNICVNPRGNLPLCMDMIRAEDVIQKIENYYKGGVYRYLDQQEYSAFCRGVEATKMNEYVNPVVPEPVG
ncbi:MAG: ADP-heptose--LPS heptosyltransferase [Verrucomicrobia bacterium]|nr:ADP-heptose--LPS heptosyltransferase [Verrucomicrobiota bacterium]